MASVADGVLTLLKNLTIIPNGPLDGKKKKETTTLLSLPNELLDVIALNLHACDKIRSLANLGLCSRRLRTVTDRLVWKEVRWKKDTWSLLGKQKKTAGWKYVEYIYYDSGVSDFWRGLRNSDIPWESILLAYWPQLKAVIERSAVTYAEDVPVVNNVWIMAENALKPVERPESHDNPISCILRWLYGTKMNFSGKARDSLDIPYPVFATEHEIGPENSTSQNATSNHHFRTEPGAATTDATLTDHLFFALQCHIVDTRPLHTAPPSAHVKSGWIWLLCCLSREALQTSKFFVKVECRKWIGVLYWLYLISSMPSYESERTPLQLQVALSTYFNLADFSDPMAHIQREITYMMRGQRRDKGINEENLPCRLMVDTFNDPIRPQPNCKHAEIDMKSAETSRVVRYGQCIWGRTEHRSYMDADLMTERDFEDWKERTEATYSKENEMSE